MDISIILSRKAEKFLARNHVPDSFATEAILKALRKLSGEHVAVDLTRLSAEWEGYYRIRVGKIRIIFSFDPYKRVVEVPVIECRGGAYQK